MLTNVSYFSKEIAQDINNLAGKPMSLLSVLKLRGNGSQRFVMLNASQDLSTLFTRDNKINYCNIELRYQGIIIRFRTVQETFAWVIPYYKLSLYQSGNQISIYGEGGFIKLIPAYNASLNQQFIAKLLMLKSMAIDQPL